MENTIKESLTRVNILMHRPGPSHLPSSTEQLHTPSSFWESPRATLPVYSAGVVSSFCLQASPEQVKSLRHERAEHLLPDRTAGAVEGDLSSPVTKTINDATVPLQAFNLGSEPARMEAVQDVPGGQQAVPLEQDPSTLAHRPVKMEPEQHALSRQCSVSREIQTSAATPFKMELREQEPPLFDETPIKVEPGQQTLRGKCLLFQERPELADGYIKVEPGWQVPHGKRLRVLEPPLLANTCGKMETEQQEPMKVKPRRHSLHGKRPICPDPPLLTNRYIMVETKKQEPPRFAHRPVQLEPSRPFLSEQHLVFHDKPLLDDASVKMEPGQQEPLMFDGWPVVRELEKQGPLTFDDAAIFFTKEEWRDWKELEEWLQGDAVKEHPALRGLLGDQYNILSGNRHSDARCEKQEQRTESPIQEKLHQCQCYNQAESSLCPCNVDSKPTIHVGALPDICTNFRSVTHTVENKRDEQRSQPGVRTKCGQMCPRRSDVKQHKSDHREKLFPCTECGKRFSRKRNSRKHQRMHSEGKPFPCTECGKSFTQKRSLKKHNRLHTGEKTFTCNKCGRHFCWKTSFIQHQLTHTSKKQTRLGDIKPKREKLFACNECGNSYNQKFNLRRHQLIHSGEKLFSCTKCGKLFFLKGDLTQHQLTHVAKKPFECNACGKSFTRKGVLVQHQRTHVGLQEPDKGFHSHINHEPL